MNDGRHFASEQRLQDLDHEDETRDEKGQGHEHQNGAYGLFRERGAVEEVVTCEKIRERLDKQYRIFTVKPW